MTLRRKIVIIITAAIGGLLLLVYLLARLILLGSYEHLEQDDARRNLDRVTNALDERLDHLAMITADWANWDDTYAFVQDGNADYIDTNLADEAIANLNLNLILFVDTSGHVVFGKALDLNRVVEVPLPEGLDQYLGPTGLLVSNEDDQRRGFIALPDGLMLVTAHPILTSAKQGPVAGTLIFAYRLDQTQVMKLADSTRLSLSVYLWDDPALPPDVRTARIALSAQTPTTVQKLDHHTLAGYAMLTDLYGTPAMLLRIDLPREIYAQGQATLTYFMVVILGLGLVVGIILLISLQKTVLAEARIGTILEYSSDAILLLRTDGTIQRVNPACKRLFNGTAFEGQRLPTLFDAEFAPALKDMLYLVAAKCVGRQMDIEVQRAGLQFHVNMALSPIRDGAGRVSGILCSLRDITAHKKLEASLRQMVEHQMQVIELKSRFITMASHEFRNPLAIIQTASDLLCTYDDKLPAEAKREELSRIRQSVRKISDLLDDVLLLGRVESGNLKFTPELLNLDDFCQYLISDFELLAGEGHHLVYVKPEVPQPVYADPRLLQHILGNLLSNAIKYSPLGSTVTLEVMQKNGHVILSVRDQGIGIPAEDQKNLFEPFHRASNVPHIPGTGLGLTIVQQAVELHGGTISFESQEEVGTTFIVKLPRRVPKAEPS